MTSAGPGDSCPRGPAASTVPHVKVSLRTVDDHGTVYDALMFVCPACALPYTLDDGTTATPSGIHLLPLKPSHWQRDGDVDAPTLTPSILTRGGPHGDDWVCHSYLRAGVFEFLGDCTHEYAGQRVPAPDLQR